LPCECSRGETWSLLLRGFGILLVTLNEEVKVLLIAGGHWLIHYLGFHKESVLKICAQFGLVVRHPASTGMALRAGKSVQVLITVFIVVSFYHSWVASVVASTRLPVRIVLLLLIWL
jgi:hypothetical protein